MKDVRVFVDTNILVYAFWGRTSVHDTTRKVETIR